MNKSEIVPELHAAILSEALHILAGSDMSEVEITERIAEIRRAYKSISDAILKGLRKKENINKTPTCANKRVAVEEG